MKIQEAATALFAQGFKEFEGVHLSWPTDTNCMVINRENGSSKQLADLYFHSDNIVVDLFLMKGGVNWLRYEYADPAFPYNLIDLLYHKILDYFGRHSRFQEIKKIIDLLLAENKRLHIV